MTYSRLLEKLKRIKNRVLPPDSPAIRGRIENEKLARLYEEILPGVRNALYIADAYSEITAISEIRRFVAWDITNIFPYQAEIHDCDDFALALAGDFAKYPGWSGFPVTYIWGDLYGGHAFATAVAWRSFEERVPAVYFIEPQNDWEIAREQVEGMEVWLLPFA